jgi:hypothetical protein
MTNSLEWLRDLTYGLLAIAGALWILSRAA